VIVALLVTCTLFTSCEANPTGPRTGIETEPPPIPDTLQLRAVRAPLQT
jgi:hypothetical protein